MHVGSPEILGYWHFLTRLGEAQNLLPAALLACLILLRQPSTRIFATAWLQALFLAALLTTASKLAFIGWGMGSALWNFTGISGHSMFAAAIYPLLAAALTSRFSPGWQKTVVLLSFALVILVGFSRIVVGAHTLSEVVAGLLLGAGVSFTVIRQGGLPHTRMSYLIPTVVAAWLILTPIHAPQLQTHSAVTRLALYLSGSQHPYTRHELLQKNR